MVLRMEKKLLNLAVRRSVVTFQSSFCQMAEAEAKTDKKVSKQSEYKLLSRSLVGREEGNLSHPLVRSYVSI